MISGFSRNRKDLTRAVRLDFQTKRGDTFFYEFDTYYVDENGEEVGYDFDGCSLKMHIKRKPTDKKPYIVVPVTAVNNTIRISLQQNVMNDTKADVYHYDVEIFDRDGNNYTILYGNFKILQDVTYWGDTSTIELATINLSSVYSYGIRYYLQRKIESSFIGKLNSFFQKNYLKFNIGIESFNLKIARLIKNPVYQRTITLSLYTFVDWYGSETITTNFAFYTDFSYTMT